MKIIDNFRCNQLQKIFLSTQYSLKITSDDEENLEIAPNAFNDLLITINSCSRKVCARYDAYVRTKPTPSAFL